MLKWLNVIKFAGNGYPVPYKEWKALLTKEQLRITRFKETERAFNSALCSYFGPGRYACIRTRTVGT